MALEVKHKLNGERLEFRCEACLLDPPRQAILLYVMSQGWTDAAAAIEIPPG